MNSVSPPDPPPTQSRSAALNSPDLYINRELSLLEFQCRVLEEAADADNPLLERVKFLAILGSNLDEFFMVRVAGLMKQVASGRAEVGRDGRPAAAQLQLIREKVRQIAAQAHDLWRREIQPGLEQQGISVVDSSSLDGEERAAVDAYFHEHVFPVLTPLAFDPGRPFPHISNRSLNLAVVVRDHKGEEHFARVKVPNTLPQLVPVKASLRKFPGIPIGAEGFQVCMARAVDRGQPAPAVPRHGDCGVVPLSRDARRRSRRPGIGE